MKRLVSLFVVIVLCFALAVPAFATDAEFVPSITYKPSVDIEGAEMNGDSVASNIIITSIGEAKDGTTNITQEERDQLLDIYDKLSKGEMQLPVDDDYVIRDMVIVGFDEENSDKNDEVGKDGNNLTVTLNLGVSSSTDLKVLTYVDGKWQEVKNVKINANGTVTIELENAGPVAFCVNDSKEVLPPQTGDVLGESMVIWAVLLMVSAVAVVVLLINRRKIAR